MLESWLNGSPEAQGILVAFVGWMAQQESPAAVSGFGPPWNGAVSRVSPWAGSPAPQISDKKPRRRSGYVARWERERRARIPARAGRPAP